MSKDKELIIEDIVVGEGPFVVKGALIVCDYEGYLEDGTLFESSIQHGRPFQTVIGVGRVIKGWDIGLMQMKQGGTRKLVIPQHLAYGEREKGLIKPYSNLTFIIKMHEVRPREN